MIEEGKQPLLSVIIPVYGVEKYIAECLDSVINQTYKNMEIIVINDGTKDNSAVIAKQYAEKDNRIKVYDFENGGISIARNRGVRIAEGKYAAFLDSDDKIHPDMYMNMIAYLENNNDVDFVKCGFSEFDDRGKNSIVAFKVNKYEVLTGNLINKFFDGVLWSVLWNAVYKTDLIKNIIFPEKLSYEDNYGNGMYLAKAGKVIVLENVYCFYRVNFEGITKGRIRKPLDKFFVLKHLNDDLQKINIIEERLYWKMAIEIYHFIRMNDDSFKVKTIQKDFYKFLIKNLDFRRRWSFRYYIIKKGIIII